MQQILISEAEIKKRIRELAAQIDLDYLGKEIALVCVLKGSVIFMADLIREIQTPLSYDFIFLSSYEGKHSSNCLRLEKDLSASLEGLHVLVVEDILDSGFTSEFLRERILGENPASLKMCVLLRRKDTAGRLEADYVGFEIGTEYVVGYGMDYHQKYRQLKDLYILTGEEL